MTLDKADQATPPARAKRPARQGRPLGDHDRRRQDVVDAVWAVLRDQGIDGITMRAVARAAGCSTGVLAHYFRGKDDMLRFSIAQMFDQLEARWTDIIRVNTPLDAIRAIALSVLPGSPQARLEWSVWLNFVARGSLAAGFGIERERRGGRIRAVIRDLLGQAVARGELAPDLDLYDRADTIVALVEGMSIVNTSRAGHDSETRRRQLLLDTLAPMLAPSRQGGDRPPGTSPSGQSRPVGQPRTVDGRP